MDSARADRWGAPDGDYMMVESVRDDGEVVIRFAGGHRLRLSVPPPLVPHYRRLHASGRGDSSTS